jgi:Ni/Fe-hydrogenase subunit HybB-like protein
MFEKALNGSTRYWSLVIFLAALAGVGGLCYTYQYINGLGTTGMGRDISWGIYIAQFTFLVGVAASAVMLVLPYYLHNYKVFGKIVVLGEFLAISAVMMCILFIMADMGKPERAINVLRYPTLNSVMFWDMMVLSGYLGLNILCGILALILKRYTKFDAGQEAINKLTTIVSYAALVNVFFVLLEVFTSFYSGIPGHMHTFQFLFGKTHGEMHNLVPWMWSSVGLGIVAIALLLTPSTRLKHGVLFAACLMLFASLWIDKGIGLVIGGFVPTPTEHIVEYHVTGIEFGVTVGIWAAGFLLLTILYKVAVSIKEEAA